MTPYRFRAVTAGILFAILAFAVLALGAVDRWALTVFEIAVFVLSGVWVFWIALGKSRLVWNPFYLPLGLVTAWSGVQYGLSLSVYRHRTASEALKWLAMWLLFAIASQVFADPLIRRGFGRALVWLVFGLCVFGLVQDFTSEGLIYWSISVSVGRIFGPFVNANHFAALLELVVPTAALLTLKAGEQRMIYAGVLLILLAAVVVGGSRMGTVLVGLEAVVVLGIQAWKTRRVGASRSIRRRWLAAPAVAFAAILTAMVLRNPELTARFGEDQPYQVRWMVTRDTWGLFLSRAWTGYGAGTFDQVYPSANTTGLDLFWPHAHNDPVQFAMEWGLVGPVALVWIMWLLFRRRWTQDQWLRAVLPVMTVLVHSWVDFPLQIPAVAAAWLLILAMLPPAKPVEDAAAR